MRKPFYGWAIVGVCFLIGITEAAVFQNILSIFMKPMARDFGWSRASVSGAISFGSLWAGVLSPLVGPILDRHGPRMVAFWGIFFLSAGLVGMTYLTRIWQLYLFFGMGRMIAVGVLNLVISVSVSNWFVRLRGRALGVTWLGSRFGNALMPVLTQFFIMTIGWRMAWGALGVLIFLISGITSLLFLRRRPEDIGLFPDGAGPVFDYSGGEILKESDPMNVSAEYSEPVWTRAQVWHTRTFWLLTCMQGLIVFVQAGINFHIYPFLTDQGLKEASAVLILSVIAVSGAVGSVTWGMLAEKFRIQRLLAVNTIVNGLVFLLLHWVVKIRFPGGVGIGIIFLLSALLGFFQGGRLPMFSIIWAEFYGRRSLGGIYGLSGPFRLTANAISPVFTALCFDLSGSYVFPFYLFVVVFFISGMINLYLRPPGISGGKESDESD